VGLGARGAWAVEIVTQRPDDAMRFKWVDECKSDVSSIEVRYTFCESPESRMGGAVNGWRLYVLPIVVAVLATWWAIWPENYVAALQAIKQPLRRTPAMRAGVDRVEAAFPLSSSKPWYPKFIRIVGILIWGILLFFGYMVYKF
jgi:hypothetical protein